MCTRVWRGCCSTRLARGVGWSDDGPNVFAPTGARQVAQRLSLAKKASRASMRISVSEEEGGAELAGEGAGGLALLRRGSSLGDISEGAALVEEEG